MIRKKGTGKLYRIVVRSELCDRYASALEGMRMESQDGRTIFRGEVKDQPHLFGILDRLNGRFAPSTTWQGYVSNLSSSASLSSRS